MFPLTPVDLVKKLKKSSPRNDCTRFCSLVLDQDTTTTALARGSIYETRKEWMRTVQQVPRITNINVRVGRYIYMRLSLLASSLAGSGFSRIRSVEVGFQVAL